MWLLLVLLAGSLFAQEKTVKWSNSHIHDYFQRNLEVIEEVDGVDWVAIPIEQKVKKNKKLRMVDGFPVQYERNGNNVNILHIKTKMKVYNFKTKKITTVNSNTDKDLWKRPKDEKIKDKIKKEKK